MFLLSKFLSVFKSEFRLCRFAFQRWMQDEERVYPHGASKSGLKPASPDAAGRPLSVLKCSFFGRLEAKWSWWVPCSHVYIAVRDKNVGKRIFFFFFVSQSAILNRISGNKTWPIFRRQNQIRTLSVERLPWERKWRAAEQGRKSHIITMLHVDLNLTWWGRRGQPGNVLSHQTGRVLLPLSSVFLNFLHFSELGVSSSEAENCIYSWLLPKHDLSWMKT